MFLGLDIGTSSVKAALFDGKDFRTVKTFYANGADQKVLDTSILREAIVSVCQKLWTELNVSPQEIEGIGLSGHGPSIVFIDQDGKELSPLVTWQDNRAEQEARELATLIPGFSKDGTSYEAKLLWFHRHENQYFEKGCTALYPKDYLLYLLCGKRVVDSSTASTFAFYARTEKKWNEAYVPVPCSVLPDIVDSWVETGKTGTPFSKLCGFSDTTPLFPGGIDAYCGAVGAGAVQEGIVVEETGTSACLSRCFSSRKGHDDHVLPTLSLTMQVISLSGGAFEWFSNLMGKTDMRAWQEAVDPARPEALLFLPYLIGERSPIWDKKASGAFLGLRDTTSDQALFQAVMQGTAFSLYQNILILEKDSSTIEEVRMVGGGSKDAKWSQMKANITGKTYLAMQETNAAATGAALVAAFGSGSLTLEQIPSLVPVSARFEPDKQAHELYIRLFRQYEAAYGNLASIMHALSDIQEEIRQ
ncbi:FGGY family carbohydrate kinase [uncultured Sphaerochaeta sp.]|uniref:xylulokinase n=1 Tax=uncultured Sphaerochaeta sp. TaxID=886478 RepID=UPI002A0A470A|nr:FGGY family carbohydrate kinase [uncultured Sphaerochaeta sp.]